MGTNKGDKMKLIRSEIDNQVNGHIDKLWVKLWGKLWAILWNKCRDEIGH